ncbi:MAG: hypothetical protein BWX66_00033 [Deltaproteobacteria bacterium ADurb.Bin058]|nr:MAG: hypothetical protein BWX66_00033 [Deltaproteobacteria bacterium ADurb.Bin058]
MAKVEAPTNASGKSHGSTKKKQALTSDTNSEFSGRLFNLLPMNEPMAKPAIVNAEAAPMSR